MFDLGIIDEVKGLMDKNITLENQCLQGIGYKETYAYLNNEITLDNAKELIKLNTRHYAKRQITFFKKMPNLTYLEPKDAKILAKDIVERL